ncbi:hypothetical protein ACFL5Z_03450 [Planctomycetota bacterium]
MATQSQIAANRRNSEKSTGPRTAEGKAAVAKNATKHGLFANKDVVISENQADFDAFRDEMLAELAPAGTMESILAQRIVSLTWRLKRAERMQNEMVDAKIRREINCTYPKLSETLVTGKPLSAKGGSKYSKECYDDLALGYIAMWDFTEARALERLSMYERRFEASLFRTMGEFKKLQRVRQSEDNEKNSAIPSTPRGQDARVTRGRDALDTLEKQSQSGAAQNDLSSFEKKEYELLIGATPPPNKANPTQREAEKRGQRAEAKGHSTGKRRRREALVCRY